MNKALMLALIMGPTIIIGLLQFIESPAKLIFSGVVMVVFLAFWLVLERIAKDEV